MLANGITDLAPLKGRFEIIAQSGERYPVDFDEAWQWIGYARMEEAKDRLWVIRWELRLNAAINNIRSVWRSSLKNCRPPLGDCLSNGQRGLVDREKVVREVAPMQPHEASHEHQIWANPVHGMKTG